MPDTTTWPFKADADLNDPLTAHRIAVTSSHPTWCYIVAFDRESQSRPDERETALLASFLDHYKDHWYGNSPFRRKMEQRELDVDGGANGAIFHKFADNDWGWRRRSYEFGFLFSVVWPGMRDEYPDHRLRGPFSLLEVMDYMHTFGGDEPIQHWQEWKAKHPEVFG